MPETRCEGIVDWDRVHQAASAAASLDADDAVAWLREREDVLGAFVNREASTALHMLEQRLGLAMNPAQRGCIDRAVRATAVAVATALQSGHHDLWVDLAAGASPRMAAIDPLLAVRRRYLLSDRNPDRPPPDPGPAEQPSQQAREPEFYIRPRLVTDLEPKGRRRRSTPRKREGGPKPSGKAGSGDIASNASDGGTVMAGRLGFVRCTPTHEDVPEKTPVLLMTSATSKGTARYDALSPAEAGRLLRDLVDGLARLGDPTARAAWTAVCGGDPSLDPPPGVDGHCEREGDDDEGDHDATAA